MGRQQMSPFFGKQIKAGQTPMFILGHILLPQLFQLDYELNFKIMKTLSKTTILLSLVISLF
jgi:hypothetical protein